MEAVLILAFRRIGGACLVLAPVVMFLADTIAAGAVLFPLGRFIVGDVRTSSATS